MTQALVGALLLSTLTLTAQQPSNTIRSDGKDAVNVNNNSGVLVVVRPEAKSPKTLSSVLTPSNDKVELGCNPRLPPSMMTKLPSTRPASPSTMVVKLGGGPTLFCKEDERVCPAVTIGDEPYVTVSKRQDGSLSLDAQVFSADGKILVTIEKNQFYVNKNNQQFFRFTQPDSHSLIVKDVRNEVSLDVRFANKRTVVITGKLFSKRGDGFMISEKEMVYLPPGAPDGMHIVGGCSAGGSFPIYVK